MNLEKLGRYRELYKKELFESCLPFWFPRCVDREYGGFFSSYDRTGKLFSSDKAVWIQGRAMWLLSFLCNSYGPREEWLDAARVGKKFIEKQCFDSDGRMFFQVTREGRPLRKRRYFFSETFQIIAFAEYAAASGDTLALESARRVFKMVMDIYQNPQADPYKVTPKYVDRTRAMRAMAVPMILLNVVSVLRRCDHVNKSHYDAWSETLTADVLTNFYKPSEKALFETVGAGGERLDCPAGRVINPGHSLEAAWFLLEEGRYRKDNAVVEKALNIIDWSLELGWDQKYGGIMSFMDIEGKPCEQLEWDMKLWWPQLEALVAVLMALDVTGDAKYEKWFDRIHDYTFASFPDREYGEWYGYLHRDGTVANTLKGSTFKGPFHLPRALMLCAEQFSCMEEKKAAE